MGYLKTKWCTTVLWAAAAGWFIAVGCVAAKDKASPAPASAPASPSPEAASPGLEPGANDGRIAYFTAGLMENFQYSRLPLDTELSKKFYDGYLDSLDPRHENFLQSDLDEFAHYRTNLDEYIVGSHERSDLTPAYEIFDRLKLRLAQHTAYMDEVLKADRFNFGTDERLPLDRRHAPWPADLDAAKKLWRQWVLYDFLQERLGREISPTNSQVILPLSKTADGEIAAKLEQQYDWTLHEVTNWTSDNVLSFYLNALTHAYDPHSDYLNEQHAADFSINMSLQLGGIGAKLGEDFGYCTIESLLPGGPAARSGRIHEKDRIVAVAQSNQPPVNTVGMDLTKVVQMIRGPKGTMVRLTLMPADDPSKRPVVLLVRDEIKLQDDEAKAKLIERSDDHGGTNRIGVIEVPSFYAPIGSDASNYISVDVGKLINKLKAEDVSGIILDMRGNPGGSLEEAVRFVGLFIKEGGPVVLARSPDHRITVDYDTDQPQLYTGPLAVMVNRFSASAAEIAAAALQDYGRAVIVGDTSTHGKGTVQNLTSLGPPYVWPTATETNDPGELKVTIRKFYRINGESTQLKGVVPDIILPDVWSYSTDIGETNLDNALPWDTLRPESIANVHYDRLNLVQPYLSRLRQLSDARIATNRDFGYIQQDIAQVRKLQADKTATLNEQAAIRQRQADDARNLARDAERAARPLPNETIYDLTLEHAGLPGLPAPDAMTATNLDDLVIATHPNGSVTVMTTNNDVITGMPLDRAAVPAVNSRLSGVVTPAQPVDPMLNETENILEDYIAFLSANHTMVANQ